MRVARGYGEHSGKVVRQAAGDARGGTSADMARFLPALTLLFALPMTVGASDPARSFIGPVMDRHHVERAAVEVPDMIWDEALADSAGRWARELARSHSFEHEDELSDDPEVEGENLWMGTRGAWSPAEMVSHWARERRAFRPGTFPAVSRTGSLEDVGHYTQMVWRNTGRVGCAVASDRQMDYLVCRYSRTGNVEGERVY